MSMIYGALGLSRAQPASVLSHAAGRQRAQRLQPPDLGIEPIRCRPDNASPTADDNVSIPATHRSPSRSTQPVWPLITAARIDMNSLIVSQARKSCIYGVYRRGVNSS